MKITKEQLKKIIKEELKKTSVKKVNAPIRVTPDNAVKADKDIKGLGLSEKKKNIKEAKQIKLPTGFFLANFGKGGKFAICFARGGKSFSAKEIVKYGKMCEQLVDKYTDEFQIHSTSDDSYAEITEGGMLMVCYYFYSEIKDPKEVTAKVDKAVHMF